MPRFAAPVIGDDDEGSPGRFGHGVALVGAGADAGVPAGGDQGDLAVGGLDLVQAEVGAGEVAALVAGQPGGLGEDEPGGPGP